MATNLETGNLGEDIACQYLVDKGYKILERNHRQKWGELDVIAKAPDKTLVFIEVKTLRQNSGQAAQYLSQNNLWTCDVHRLGIEPEEQLTSAKLRKFKKAAMLYAGHYPEKIDERKGWRIDLISIVIKGYFISLTNYHKDCVIKHYENVA